MTEPAVIIDGGDGGNCCGNPIECSANHCCRLLISGGVVNNDNDDCATASYEKSERLWAPRFPEQPTHDCQYGDLNDGDLCIICFARYKSYRLECGHLFCLECVQHSHKGYFSGLKCTICCRIMETYGGIAPHRSNYNAFVPIYERYYPGLTSRPLPIYASGSADDCSDPATAHIVRELNADMWAKHSPNR